MRESKLNTEIKRLQKNARNKLYRLRKKGAINAQIGSANFAVKPMSEVNAMTKRDKMRYVRELKQFNSRDNKIKFEGDSDYFIVQKNSVALPAVDVWNYRIAEAQANVERAAIREQIETAREEVYSDMTIDEAVEFSSFEIEPEQQADFLAGGKSINSRFQDLTPVIMREGFESIEKLKAATQRAESAIFNMNLKRNTKRYEDWRRGIVARMVDNGYEEGAEWVADLTVEQMDWLRYYTDFAELTSTYLYDAQYARGLAMADEHTLASYEKLIIDLVKQAKKIAVRYEI